VTVPSRAVEGRALYGFRVGVSPGRPIRPDAAHTYVTVVEDDSTAGAIRAGCLAAQVAHGTTGCAMVTSTELVAVEL
jgi:hypothetical protein